MKLYLIRNLNENKDLPNALWFNRKEHRWSAGSMGRENAEVVEPSFARMTKLRNFVRSAITTIDTYNIRMDNSGLPNSKIDKAKVAVICIDLTSVTEPSIKYYTLDEALELKA